MAFQCVGLLFWQGGSTATGPSSGRGPSAWAAAAASRSSLPSDGPYQPFGCFCFHASALNDETPADFKLAGAMISLNRRSHCPWQGGGRLFSREGSSYREGSAQPDTPAAGRRGGAVGERSRLGQAPPETVSASLGIAPNSQQRLLHCPCVAAFHGRSKLGSRCASTIGHTHILCNSRSRRC